MSSADADFDPRRRALLSGRLETHISSLVIHALPAGLDRVQDEIARLPGATIDASSPAGKLVVTLETASEKDIASHLGRIQSIKGVLAATLVYHQIETSSDA
jgi:periplasmic nitrate reductase NapD